MSTTSQLSFAELVDEQIQAPKDVLNKYRESDERPNFSIVSEVSQSVPENSSNMENNSSDYPVTR